MYFVSGLQPEASVISISFGPTVVFYRVKQRFNVFPFGIGLVWEARDKRDINILTSTVVFYRVK